MLFDLPHLADLNAIGHKCQWLVSNANIKKIMKCIYYDYAIEDKVLIIHEDVDHKARDEHIELLDSALLHNCRKTTLSRRGKIHN